MPDATNDHDFVVMSAVRYAMPRMTYVPESVIRYVRNHWDDLTDDAQRCILKDVEDSLQSNGCGDYVYHKQWSELYKWMVERRADELRAS